MTSNSILIILLNYNGKQDTLECLASLQKVTYPHFNTIVIDNGSSDDSVAVIRKQFPHTPVFETHQNLGFAAGNNIGIEWGLKKGYPWILLLNNDTTVDPDFLHGFMRAHKEKPQAKILGAKIYRSSHPQEIDHLGGYWNSSIAEFVCPYTGKIEDHQSYETMQSVDYVCGAALLMHRSVPETIGLLEPRYFLFWEETDFCQRAIHAKMEVWTAPQAKIWHKVSSSFSGGKPQMSYFWWRSRLLWIERNLPEGAKYELYQSVIYPDVRKVIKHYLLKSLQNFLRRLCLKKPTHLNVQKVKRYKASLIGIWDFYRNQFGNCPKSLK